MSGGWEERERMCVRAEMPYLIGVKINCELIVYMPTPRRSVLFVPTAIFFFFLYACLICFRFVLLGFVVAAFVYLFCCFPPYGHIVFL